MNDILDTTAFPQLATLLQNLPDRIRAVQPVWTELEQVAYPLIGKESQYVFFFLFQSLCSCVIIIRRFQAKAALQRNRIRALTALAIHREQVEIVLDAVTNERRSGLTEPVSASPLHVYHSSNIL